MAAHDRGAIAMAEIELAGGINTTTKRLAKAIIAAQAREIHLLNAWRAKWFGAPGPSSDGPMSMAGGG